MTGYTVHTGSTEQFAEGWDHIFGKSKTAAARTSAKKKPAAKKKGAKAAAGSQARQSVKKK